MSIIKFYGRQETKSHDTENQDLVELDEGGDLAMLVFHSVDELNDDEAPGSGVSEPL
jgi:hypothetical protein